MRYVQIFHRVYLISPCVPLCLPPLEANHVPVCCFDKCDVDTDGARREKFNGENVCTFIGCGFLIEGEGLNIIFRLIEPYQTQIYIHIISICLSND